MVFAFFVLAIEYALNEQYVRSALYFAITLNLKHIFLYSAPAFGLLYVRNQVLNQKNPGSKFKQFLVLAAQTTLVFTLSFGPVVFTTEDPAKNLKQIMSRLFPFQRGLVHDYMCPNVWCLYTAGLIAQHRVGRLYHALWLKDGQAAERFIQSDLGNYEFY